MAGHVLTLADGQAAQVAQRAQTSARAMLEAAERDAAAIREAAQRDADDMRARVDSMLSELGRVAAYLTENYAIPALPAIPPALPGARPDFPAARPDLDGAAPDLAGLVPPYTMPAGPDSRPGTRPAQPARAPRTTPPAKRTTPPAPRTGPTKAPAKSKGNTLTTQERIGRQRRAMRIAKWGTTAIIAFVLAASSLEMHHNGYAFFVFRENGQGDSPSSGPGRVGVDQLDSQFLAAQAAARAKAAQHAPTGRHAKTSPSPNASTATSTTGG